MKKLNLRSEVKMLLLLIMVLGVCISCKSGEKKTEAVPEAELQAQAEPEPTPDMASELQRIHYDYDKYNIRSDAAEVLEKNASYLKSHPDVWIQIEGHCDERGSEEYNLALGEKRANAAKEYLVNLGISAGRVSIISYGEEKPLEKGSDEYSWSMNRRAEFVVVSKGM